jgi:PAS domain S-box-containing protein
MSSRRPLQVLLVEDVDDDAALVELELRRGGYDPTILRVETAADMSAALARDRFQLVISDYHLPRFDAPAALHLLQQHELDLPFIIVSGTIGESIAVEAMKAGAHDYLLKGALTRLVPAIERELREAAGRAERRRAEAALRRSELRLRALIEAIPDLVVVSRDERFVYVNPAFEKVFGQTSDELVGADVATVLGAGGAAARARGEQRWVRGDGQPIFVQVTAQALDFDGAPALLEVARDVTDRVRAEEALRSSEERFRTLVSSIDDFVFTLDAEQRYTGAFGGWLEREALRPSHFLGKTVREALGPDAANHHAEAHARALAGEPSVYEWSMTGGDEPRYFQTALAPLDGAGAVVGIVGVARETTEQRRLQAQLLVSDRMASVGTLAAGVAHEINNPLAVVLANLELASWDTAALGEELAAERAPAPSTLEARVKSVAESAREARESAERVRDIVRDLKLFSRAGDEEHRGPVDVTRVLDSSSRMAWNEIRHRSTLVKAYTDVPLVFGNEARLGQVFLNLIVNAAQAIPEGRATQNEIRLVTHLHPSGHVAVDVKDTGEGIAPEVLGRIFTPFYTTKPVGVGTGLGLAICHRIVASFKGRIEVESELGKGTTFRVLLPVADDDLVAPRPAPPSVFPASRRGRILVVDDEPMIGSAVRRILSAEHEVSTAIRASEALGRLAAGERYDVILCDLMMPEITGMDFYARVSEASPAHRERIVFLTGGAFTAAARAFLDTIENPRVEKPFDADVLRGVVNARVQ